MNNVNFQTKVLTVCWHS